MFDFQHKHKDFWTAIGYADVAVEPKIKAMQDFVSLYQTVKPFRESYDATPRSFQVKFLMEEILDIDQDSSKETFLAGMLIGSFQLMQKIKIPSTTTSTEDMEAQLESLLKQFGPKDSDDF
tara:strand:+ start:3016 stop:3378 length:363 start_codon:yes stop_codon:yes gene_type:complete